jgi:hypothetical protein
MKDMNMLDKLYGDTTHQEFGHTARDGVREKKRSGGLEINEYKRSNLERVLAGRGNFAVIPGECGVLPRGADIEVIKKKVPI